MLVVSGVAINSLEATAAALKPLAVWHPLYTHNGTRHTRCVRSVAESLHNSCNLASLSTCLTFCVTSRALLPLRLGSSAWPKRVASAVLCPWHPHCVTAYWRHGHIYVRVPLLYRSALVACTMLHACPNADIRDSLCSLVCPHFDTEL